MIGFYECSTCRLCWRCICLRVMHVFGFRYYEGGVSSVYFWDLDDGFAGVVLLKKSESDPQSNSRTRKLM